VSNCDRGCRATRPGFIPSPRCDVITDVKRDLAHGHSGVSRRFGAKHASQSRLTVPSEASQSNLRMCHRVNRTTIRCGLTRLAGEEGSNTKRYPARLKVHAGALRSQRRRLMARKRVRNKTIAEASLTRSVSEGRFGKPITNHPSLSLRVGSHRYLRESFAILSAAPAPLREPFLFAKRNVEEHT
jgi:hypothetical protein